MVEGCDGGRLAMKALAEARIARVLLGEHFDRHGDLQAWMS